MIFKFNDFIKEGIVGKSGRNDLSNSKKYFSGASGFVGKSGKSMEIKVRNRKNDLFDDGEWEIV